MTSSPLQAGVIAPLDILYFFHMASMMDMECIRPDILLMYAS